MKEPNDKTTTDNRQRQVDCDGMEIQVTSMVDLLIEPYGRYEVDSVAPEIGRICLIHPRGMTLVPGADVRLVPSIF